MLPSQRVFIFHIAELQTIGDLICTIKFLPTECLQEL